MNERKIEIVIGADGRLKAETHGFVGKDCTDALEKILAEIAFVDRATPKAEARDQESEPKLRRDVRLGNP